MEKLRYLVLVFLPFFSFAQVGINTTTPGATLDVNGDLIVRTAITAPTSSTYNFLVWNTTNGLVEKVVGNMAGSTNLTISKAVKNNNVSLLSGSLFAGWQKIDFASGDVPINSGTNFDAATDFYNVPSDGIYEIFYEFRYGTGVILSLLGNARIGILSHTGSGYTVLDQRYFSGATIPIVGGITISSSAINSVYRLTAGDQLSFEVNSGGIGLGVLPQSFASVVVKKISD